MKRKIKFAVKLVLSLGAAGTLLYVAFSGVDLAEFTSAIRDADPLWLIGALILLIGTNLLRAWRWNLLLKPIATPPSVWRTFESILIGYAANNVVPRAGEVARAIALRRWIQAPLSSLFATVLVERVVDLLALLVIFGPVWLNLEGDITAVFPWMKGVSVAALVGSLVILGMLVVLALYGEEAANILKRCVARFSEHAAERVGDLMRNFFQGMQAMVRPSVYLEIAASTLLLFLLYVFVIYLPFVGFDFLVRYDLDFSAAIVVMVISTIGLILPTPGGAGTYHFFCSQSLHHLYGVPLPEALAFATVVHAFGYIGYTVIGGPGLVTLILHGKSGPVLSATESELK